MEQIIMELMGDLEGMGYSREWRTKVLKGAMMG